MENELIDFEKFEREFLKYYEDLLLNVEFNSDKSKLLAVIKPDKDFDETVAYISDSILDTVDFDYPHIDVRLYQFGDNEFIELGIN